eukprot:CAMPEP_0177583588 /NCGR_PEP_ID=MMETSP0419_2-20121207/3403_1 /TAXON_ID=582737 /ORGANISM="Tetraselmis sp., Strain GSL018" /LENGTH=282 /DNA_ID=CAMNT_0019072991 /DNA_START=393 /DNA_END=1241 /DNA_ORIENTATION=+
MVQNLLLQSPPGELEYVCRDLREIVKDDELVAAAAVDVFEKQNEEQMVTVRVKDSNTRYMLSRAGRIGACTYLDPKTETVITVDHPSKTVTGRRPAVGGELPPAEHADLRKAVERAMEPYMREAYPEGMFAVYGGKELAEGVSGLIVCISSATLRARNFVAGRWVSEWRVALRPEPDFAAHMCGDMKARVHYFEDGNVHLRTSYSGSAEVVGEDCESLALAIVQAISGGEALFLKDLEDCFQIASQRATKDMRRGLPRTGMKFPWSSRVLQLHDELKQSQTK